MNQIFGKVFRASDGSEYGIIRKACAPYPEEVSGSDVIAEDECGNYFIEQAGVVSFWDHETGEASIISKSLQDFINACITPPEVELDQGQVEAVWIDPEFAKKYGIDSKP